MRLYIKEKVFSWGDQFYVFDRNGEARYRVQGEVFSFGKKLHVYDRQGREAAFIRQELLTLLPRYTVFVDGREIARVKREFSLFFPRFTIEGLGWECDGSFWEHSYQITQRGVPIVTIEKEWMTWGDSYVLDIRNPADELMALAMVLTIDCVAESDSN